MVKKHNQPVGMNLRKPREMVEDRGAWHAAVLGVAKSQTGPSDSTRRAGVNIQSFALLPFSCMPAHTSSGESTLIRFAFQQPQEGKGIVMLTSGSHLLALFSCYLRR